MKYKVLIALILSCASFITNASIIRWADNGHYYELVNTTVGELQARQNALNSTHYGRQGYLVTITSQAEQNFILSLFGNNPFRAWIGLSDQVDEGVWRWMDGPEAGMEAVYTFWAPREPNDYSTGEDFAAMNWNSAGQWNDWGGPAFTNVRIGYIVEYSEVSAPATLGLFIVAGLALIRIKRKV